MEFQNLVQELNSPKTIWTDGVVTGFKPPTSLELRAARAIQQLSIALAAVTGSLGPVEELKEEKNEDCSVQ